MTDIAAIVVIDEAPIDTVVLPVPATPVVVVLGIQGPPGPPGTGGVAEAHIHTQSSASDTWVINHNFGRRPVVELYTVGGVAMEGTLIHVNDNQVQALFSSPLAGFATLV